MAYFSNGSEGDYYEERYCRRCVHDSQENGCPVLALHMLWNYDQHSDEDKKLALNALWPREKEGIHNADCSMFVEDKSQIG